MPAIPKHVAAGLLFAAIGIIYGSVSLLTLPMGSAFNMGPGYFPLALCAILVILGTAAAIRGSSDVVSPIPLRGILLVFCAILFFGVSVRSLGLLPTVAASSLIASFASRTVRWRQSVVASVALAVLTSFLFVRLLGLPLPVFGPLLINW